MWFLIAVVLLVVWLSERSSLKKKNEESYNRGWWDGYGYLKSKISSLDVVNKATITQTYTSIEPGASNTVEQSGGEEQSAQLDDDPGALFQETNEAAATYDQSVVFDDTSNDSQFVQPDLSPEELQAEKERRTLQNLNILLYVGSFLIVAAAALFVTLVMPVAVKLGCLIFVTTAFYVSGLVLHARSVRLKPAALAFTGTGLAILPFVGFALTALGGFSGQSAWFITSVVGLVAYAVAAVRLQSQLVSYLTMAFVLSLSLSAVATLGLSMVWYFIVLIGVSVVCNSIHYLWPTVLPKIFWQPVEQTGVMVTPIALAASLVMYETMDITAYEVLFGLATMHYIVAWLEQRSILYETLIRILAHITILIVAYDVVGGFSTEQQRVGMNIAIVGTAMVQVMYSLVRTGWQKTSAIESSWTGVAVTLIVLDMPLWLGLEHTFGGISFNLLLIGLISLMATLQFRSLAWAYTGLAVSAVLPFVFGRLVVEPAVPYEVFAVVFAALAAVGLFAYERARAANRSAAVLSFIGAATASYAILTVCSGVAAGNAATLGWSTLLGGAVFVTLSYLTRETIVELFGAALAVVSIASWAEWLQVAGDWKVTVISVAGALVLGAGAFLHHIRGEYVRRDGLAVGAGVVFTGLALNLAGSLPAIRTSVALLLGAGAAMLVLRGIVRSKSGVLGSTALAFYIVYPVIAVLLALSAGAGWLALALLGLAVMLWVSSYVEATPVVLLFGHVAFYLCLHSLWSWLGFAEEWRFFGTTWLATGVAYVWSWFAYGQKDTPRQQLSLASCLVALGAVTVFNFFAFETRWAAAASVSLLVGAGMGAIEGAVRRRNDYVELSIYAATLALQRLASLALPEMNMVFYAHWWATVLVLVAAWRHAYHVRCMVALAFVTAATGFYALSYGENYSLLFLIEHLIVAIIGATLRKQWAMWWGIVAVIVAILYFLRNFTALALLFLGFLLILFVVWRLLKVGKK